MPVLKSERTAMQVKDIRSASLITAIKTPFTVEGKIDLKAFDYLIEKQIGAGVDGIIVGGTTGEGHLLDWEEHLMLIAHSASQYGDKLVIVGNTGSNNTREAVKATEYGFASGMHASLQINPYYGKTTQTGVQKHLENTLELGPAIIYNVEGRTGQDISTGVIESLSNHPNFVGVKECAGNERIGYYESKGIPCWSGNDDQAFEGRHKFNSHGVISVTSNLVPEIMRSLMDQNKPELNESLSELYDWLFCEPNPISLNTALSMTKAIEPVFRLPYLPLNKDLRNKGIEILRNIEPNLIVGDALQTLEDEDFTVVV